MLKTTFRLAGVLRARQAQETVAKAATGRSRAAARLAAKDVERRSAGLDSAPEIHARTASALVAALISRQSMAASLSAATGLSADADAAVDASIADLTLAAAQRRAMETLAERHAATRRRAAEAAERREIDDLVNTRYAGRIRAGGDAT
jgi:flagellar protein FliJ